MHNRQGARTCDHFEAQLHQEVHPKKRNGWLNALRNRVLDPARTQEVQQGDSIKLSVHGKYKDLQKGKTNMGSFISSGAKQNLITDLLEFGTATARSAEPNAITVFNIIDLLVKDLQKKDVPEAYMMYALYDSDSVLYKTGKQVLTKNAANRHEELEEDLYISEDGYMEAFLVNETQEDVWFDDFSIQSTSSFIVQETHGACPDGCRESMGTGADRSGLPGRGRGEGEQVSLQRERNPE